MTGNLFFLIRILSKKTINYHVFQAQFKVKWMWGTEKQDSSVRVKNRGVGTAEEFVSLRFLA